MPKNPILAYHHLYHLSRTGCPISLKQLKSQFQQFDQLYQSQGTAIDHCDLEQLMCLSYLLGKIHEDPKFYHLTNAVFYYSYVCQLAENNAFRCIFGNKAIRHMEKLISKQPKEAIKKSSKTKRILYKEIIDLLCDRFIDTEQNGQYQLLLDLAHRIMAPDNQESAEVQTSEQVQQVLKSISMHYQV